MTAEAETEQPTRSQRAGAPVLVGLVLVAAYLAIAVGLTYAGMAALGRGTFAEAPVRIAAPIAVHGEMTLPCVEGWSPDGSQCTPAASPDQWPGGETLPVRRGGELLVAAPADLGGKPDTVTALLGTASSWGGFIAAGVVGLALVPVARSTASGRPFARGNAPRVALAGGVVATGWLLATLTDFAAATRIVAALEATPRFTSDGDSFTMPPGWLVPVLHISWWPGLIALLLVGLAWVTHRGSQLASDTEGLV